MQLHGGDVGGGIERGRGAAERAQGNGAQQQRAAQPVRNRLRERRPGGARADGHERDDVDGGEHVVLAERHSLRPPVQRWAACCSQSCTRRRSAGSSPYA